MLKLRSVVGACLAAIVLVLGLASPAAAHTVSSERMMGDFAPNECIHNTAQVDDGVVGGGRSLGETSVWLKLNGCGPDAATKPAGWIAARVDLWKWSVRAAEWRLCREMKGWALNSTRGYKLVVQANWNTPCGQGYYATESYSAAYTFELVATDLLPSPQFYWAGRCCVHFWSGWYPSNGQEPFHHWLPAGQAPKKQTVGPPYWIAGHPLRNWQWGIDPAAHPLPDDAIVGRTDSSDQYGDVTTLELGPDAFIAYDVP